MQAYRGGAFLVPIFLIALSAAHACGDESISFGLQIRPILAEKCFHCHGPDESHREAKLRLDQEESAKGARDPKVIVPGKPEESEFMTRILSHDPETMMPPPSANKTLSAAQIELLRKWISQGAPWDKHWSFEPPRQPNLPKIQDSVWPKTPIDFFVLAELEKRGLSPAPPADPHELCRRIHLDLIGLPPTPEAADEFAQEAATDRTAAVERLTTSLLQSPHFGEHWARMWLDLARYADTKGYEKDLHRDLWPYRDWVIEAFNADMPFDQFTREQLAGDLLPGDDNRPLVATAMHRATMSNDEGGTDDEEFRVAAVKDRIDTTAQIWMGLTLGCAKCHSHKYDPITLQDYYRFFALFNQTEDADRYDDAPTLALLAPEQQAAKSQFEEQLAGLRKALQKEEAAVKRLAAEQEKLWQPLRAESAKSLGGARLTIQDDGAIQAAGHSAETDIYELSLKISSGRYTTLRIEALPARLKDGQQGVGRNPDDPNFVLSELVVEQLAEDAEPRRLALAQPRADFSQDGWNVAAAIDGDTKTGWAVSPRKNERHLALLDFAPPLEVTAAASLRVTLSQQYGNRLTMHKFRLRVSTAPANELNPIPSTPEAARLRREIESVESKRREIDQKSTKLPILRELAEGNRRATRIHTRGNFLDLGEEVQPETLAAFGPLPPGSPKNRLGVAAWLTSPDNPLTPRVMANRVWARLFGLGLVETEEDFGSQGQPPSHPALLDWLALHYRDEAGWSLKTLLRTIVSSATYQQAFVQDEQREQLDPRNVWMSRGPRQRLSAEVVRDQALAVSGLLSRKIGGPSVMPPQPDGLWRSTYNAAKWTTSAGEDRYRRGLYTYWKRTSPYPSMVTFDAGSGEVCLVRRIPTNTPLQALVALNDPVYLEAAGALARRMTEQEGDEAQRVERGLRLALIRPVHESEIEVVKRVYHESRAEFSANSQAAADFLKEAHSVPPAKMDEQEFAAWTVTASVILNLDELVMK